MAERLLVTREDGGLEREGQLAVRLSPDAQTSLGLGPGDAVRIATYRGRQVYGRLAAPLPEDRGRGSVRMGRWQRQALKARLYEEVQVEPARLEPLRRLILHPALHVTSFDFLTRTLREELARERAPLTPGMLLYFPVRAGGGGMAFTVSEAEPGAGFFTAETEFHIEWDDHGHTHAPGQGHGGSEVTLEDVGGLDEAIALVRHLVQLPLQFPEVYRTLGITLPRGVIFCGPPGVGKTHLARALASEVDARFYPINGPEIVGTMYGETETNLRRIFSQAIAHSPAVILIDEIDAIAPKRDQAGSQSDVRMVTQLLSLMDGLQRVDGVMVIGTTNRIDAIDVALRRPGRFDREVYIRPPDAAGRLDILRVQSREMPLDDEAIAFLPELARRTHGFVGADLMELCREAGLQSLRRLAERDLLEARRGAAEVTVGRLDFEAALRRVRPSALRETVVTRPSTSWEEIAGLDAIKERLHDLLVFPFREPEAFRAAGLRPPRGILLHGPHGTGKTLLAQAAAHAARVNLVSIDGPEIFSKWLGESEEAIRHLFQVARQLAPCIVFVDQLDAIAPRRSEGGDSRTAERVVNQLLVELDALDAAQEQGIAVIAATDRLDRIDPSILRGGRLGIHIHVPLPNAADRAAILRLCLKPIALAGEGAAEAWSERLAARTEGLSGADLRALVDDARLRAYRREGAGGRLAWEDLEGALAGRKGAGEGSGR